MRLLLLLLLLAPLLEEKEPLLLLLLRIHRSLKGPRLFLGRPPLRLRQPRRPLFFRRLPLFQRPPPGLLLLEQVFENRLSRK